MMKSCGTSVTSNRALWKIFLIFLFVFVLPLYRAGLVPIRTARSLKTADLVFQVKTADGVTILVSVCQDMVGDPTLELVETGFSIIAIRWEETASVREEK